MKIKVEILQVRCRQVTHPRTDADEVYVAYAVGLATSEPRTKSAGKLAIAGGRVSSVKTHVTKNSQFVPEGGLSAVVDVGDAIGAFVAVAVFEKDDGKLHTKLQNDLSGILEPPRFDWKQITLPSDITNWGAWLKLAWKAAGEAFKHVLRDDHLGVVEIPIVLDASASEDDWTGLRELRFKRYGGDYRVAVRFTKA